MQTYNFTCDRCQQPREVRRPMGAAHLPAYCPACDAPMRRRYSAPQIVMRPGGWNLKPGDKGWEPNWERARELGELKDDATPVARYGPAMDAIEDDRFPADPERDRKLHQLVRQHWTEDLSEGVAENRRLAAKALAEDGVIPPTP
jgi:putative FmdB family regulatory protein